MEQTGDEAGQRPPPPAADDARQEPLLRPADEEPAKPQLFKDSRNRLCKEREGFSSSWWWWEISGAIVTLIGLFMTIAVLAVLDGKPIDDWKYSIQPNSLLSTLTTVAKTGVMLIVASCVSQLKWLHFQQANRLSHLEMYDEVSRGSPVGAGQMLWKMGCQLLKLRLDIIATAFALISLLSLAIDPMIQQILAVHQQDLQLRNITATIGSSNAYISNVTFAIASDNFSNNVTTNTTGPLVFQMALLNQLASASVQPDLSCPSPATRCEFSNITTLRLCRNYTDVTDISDRTCKAYPYPPGTVDQYTPPPPSHYINCTYTVKGVTNYRNLTINFGGVEGATYDWFRSILDIMELKSIGDGGPFDIARMFFIRVDDGVENDLFLRDTSLPVPTAHIAMANWYWCSQTYNNISMRDGKLTGMASASTNPLIPSVVSDDPGSLWTFYGSEPPYYEYYSNFLVAEFMDHFFLLDTKNPHILNSSLQGELHPQIYVGGQSGQANSTLEGYTGDMFGMANFMSYTNWSELTQNVATAMTNQVLTNADNNNFTSTTGTAFVNTAYYHVRWAWLVLPLLEAVATAALLAVTILLNRLPLLKSSSTALLVHGLEDTSDLRVVGNESTQKWGKLGDGIKVIWTEDEKGWTRLTRI